MSAFDDLGVRQALRIAWEESQPGTAQAHEEGGFVLRDMDGSVIVERWPRGAQDRIEVPPYAAGLRAGKPIIVTFHTHPNPEPHFEQGPSLTDIRAVRDDADLHHPDYEGEYVIADATVYHILPTGRVAEMGSRIALLGS